MLVESLMRILNFENGLWDVNLEDIPADLEQRFRERANDFQVNEDGSFRAQNPWHAAIILLFVSTQFAELLGNQIQNETNQPDPPPFISFIFRGQGNPTWDFRTTAERADPLRRRQSERTRQNFEQMLDIAFQNVLPNGGFEGLPLRSISQHYGLPTDLLDWTTDPLVAVFFAIRQAAENPEAVVHQLWLPTALENGLEILLPPPAADRLFLQRGVFLTGTREQFIAVRNNCFSVTFPVQRGFEIFRPGANVPINLLPPDPKINRVRNLARLLAIRFPENNNENLAVEIQRRTVESRFIQKIRRNRNLELDWFIRIQLMVRQIAVFRREDRIVVLLGIVERIARSNSVLLANWGSPLFPDTQHRSLLRLPG